MAEGSKLDGAYDCMTKTPLGDQASVFTIVTDGDAFHGTNASPLGSLDVQDGKVEGNRLSWRMDMVTPLKMTLLCRAIINGDMLAASIDTGSYGTITMTGRRRA